ncbi:UDP-glucose 4-epimerase [Phlyctema vagabunda]|uniref:UDP-glucose 4-epimerase n=1 Tax=Phlyctema vagabunda TaxID=108571 RepID=A0ABR4PHF6_9HELO
MPATLPVASMARDSTRKFPIVLVTGGSGYIGSHTVLQILKSGCAVVVIDNLINSHMESLIRVYHIAKAEFTRLKLDLKTLPPLFFHSVDLCDKERTSNVFQFWNTYDSPSELVAKLDFFNIATIAETENYKMLDYSVDDAPSTLDFDGTSSSRGTIVAVVHFAALKAVGESVSQPLQYYHNNITGLLNLLDAMTKFGINRLVFSSSAVVYGSGKEANISEDAVQVGGQGTGGGLITNPYGRSKWMAEEILNDCCVANPNFHVTALRYFNPTGSHPSGLIGEDPKGVPNNIVPVILQAYQRRRSKVYVFGSEYDTSDGTGVRDYIHVEDLARGHVAALRALLDPNFKIHQKGSLLISENSTPVSQQNYHVYNLGSGNGYSVLEIIKAFATVSGADIPYTISDARPGDLGTVTASTNKAKTELGWEAQFGIQNMCRDVYAFASENPLGYERLRRLSTLALKDPDAFRKASIGATNDSDLEGAVAKFARLASDANSFDDAVRRLSTLSEGIKNEVNGDSIVDIGPPSLALQASEKGWGNFAEDWHHSIPDGSLAQAH